MFRLAQAYFALKDYDSAEEYAINASTFFPEDKDLMQLRDNIKDKLQELALFGTEQEKPATESEPKEQSEPVKEEPKKEEPKKEEPKEEVSF